ncbi:hypothetical protein CEE45_04195 [Candidatus Heimdallarchaeota archaeon B3_Heim]|nr:MAG: hypothetical protein CEE45_04195 [Candidatus Heimdallarchaeota archaeon B3_Heim]
MVESYSDGLLAPFAKYMSKYGDWQISDLGASILVPKSGYHFNSILVRSKRLSYSSDKSWEFTASVVIIDKENFSSENILLFQRLKGYECELERTGFVRKNYRFHSSPFLEYLQNENTNVYINSSLVEILNQESSLLQCIHKIVPDQLSVRLFSQPIITKDLDEYSRKFKERYESPSELIWNISIEKFIDVIFSKKKYFQTLDLIIELLEDISINVQRITKETEARL